MPLYRLTIAFLLILLAASAGCENKSVEKASRDPVSIQHGDECHVCGMLIINYPGPKGEAFERGHDTVRKFCSTRDLFSYLLQPETSAVVREIYVHDMADADWMNPLTASMVDARQAWYVANQPLRGAMGPTLATFAKREAAEQFIQREGGRLMQFDDINLEVITELDYGQYTAPEPQAPEKHDHH